MEAARGVVIALVGAESTGKTTLALALAERLRIETGHRVTVVGEYLREWCGHTGRTPRIEEQAVIVAEQRRRIDAAAEAHAVVIADTTPLMTAVYHRIVFNDRSLDEPAARWHAERVDHTLVTALDLPWVADGHQRDGEHVRVPVDTALRELLAAHRIGWSRVAGLGDARTESALDAVAPLLRRRTSPKRGLFTRLAQRDAAQRDWPWVCDCDQADCEHALRQRQLTADDPGA
jgi:nicotinamide riboside kinase